jgi:hypothetical protein
VDIAAPIILALPRPPFFIVLHFPLPPEIDAKLDHIELKGVVILYYNKKKINYDDITIGNVVLLRNNNRKMPKVSKKLTHTKMSDK